MGKHIHSSNLSVIHLSNVPHKSEGCAFVGTLCDYISIAEQEIKKAYFPDGLHFFFKFKAPWKSTQTKCCNLETEGNDLLSVWKCQTRARQWGKKWNNRLLNQLLALLIWMIADNYANIITWWNSVEFKRLKPAPVLGEIPLPSGNSKRLKWFGQNFKQVRKSLHLRTTSGVGFLCHISRSLIFFWIDGRIEACSAAILLYIIYIYFLQL